MKILTLTALLCAISSSISHAEVKRGDVAPDFDLEALNGAHVKLSSLRGKLVVLEWWMVGCQPCRDDLSDIEEAHKRYPEVTFLSISATMNRAQNEATVAQLKLTFPTLLLDKGMSVGAAYEPPSMPTYYVIDKTGRVRMVHPGHDEKATVETLSSMLDALGAKRSK